jgi:hypothetical protein
MTKKYKTAAPVNDDVRSVRQAKGMLRQIGEDLVVDQPDYYKGEYVLRSLQILSDELTRLKRLNRPKPASPRTTGGGSKALDRA